MTLLKARDQQVRARTATILEIRSQLNVEGVRLGRGDAKDFPKQEALVPVEFAPLLAPLFKSLRAINGTIATYDGMIEAEGEALPIVAKPDVIDGVGPITALAFAFDPRCPCSQLHSGA